MQLYRQGRRSPRDPFNRQKKLREEEGSHGIQTI